MMAKNQYESLLEQADKHLKEEEYEEAFRIYVECINFIRNYAKSVLDDQDLSAEEKNKETQEVEKRESFYICDRIYEIGENWRKKQKYENAINAYQKILEINKDYSTDEFIYKFAELYFEAGLYQEAAKRYIEYCQNTLDNHDAILRIWAIEEKLEKLATDYVVQIKYQEAITLYRDIIKIASSYKRSENDIIEHDQLYQVNALYHIADIHARQKEYEEEIDIYLEILKIAPERSDIHDRIKQNYQKTIEREENIRLAQAEKSRQKLSKIISQYTHALGNMLFPYHVQKVEETLKRSGEFSKEALLLEKIFQAELLVKRQGQLLALKHTGVGEGENFRRRIRMSCLRADAQENYLLFSDMLNLAAERVLMRLLDGRLKGIQKKLEQKYHETIEHWNHSFEEEVFFKKYKTAIGWAKKYIASIDYTVSPCWKKLKVEKEGYAEALLLGYFGELLVNALKYHNPEFNIWVNVIFDEENNYLTSLWENPYIPQTDEKDILSGRGLDSIKNDLEMLNQNEPELKTLEIQREKQLFRVKLYFSKNLLIDDTPKEQKEDYSKFFQKEGVL